MKILIIGFFVFIGWSIFSTYIYVCKINCLCQNSHIINEVKTNTVVSSKPIIVEKDIVPKDWVIYFAFDKSDFLQELNDSDYFSKTYAYFLKNPQAKLIITGHTDAVGTMEYNQSLGLRRAQSLYNYFDNKGITLNRMIIESNGENNPVADNKTDEGRAQNRRTVVNIKY
jgi:OmpA-OmpF porin, OOP family